MTTVVVTPPAALPLSIQELRAHCRLSAEDPSDEDALLMAYLRAATAWIDGPDGWLNRALITQELEYRTSMFPRGTGWITLPCPPLQAVDEITYVADGTGVVTILDPSVYQVVGVGSGYSSRLTVAYNETWPLVERQQESIIIRYTAGYGASWNDVPEPIRQALLMLVAYWYNQREGALIDPIIVEVPFGVKALLNSYKTYVFS